MNISPPSSAPAWSRSQGFSLFELVAFIIVVAIIYASAARRFSEFPGEAERANFIAISTQIQTAINIELMVALSRGQRNVFNVYENANPMDLLLEPPSNYLGAFDVVDTDRLERRSWYFDLRRQELVYLVNDTEGVYWVLNGRRTPAEEIRLKIQLVRHEDSSAATRQGGSVASEQGTADSGTPRGNVSGLRLEPVIPYEWGNGRSWISWEAVYYRVEASPAAL